MSLQEDEDLEDGEIASDEDDPVGKEKAEGVDTTGGSFVAAVKPAAAPPPPIPEKLVPRSRGDSDFEKDLQKLKEDVERKKNRKDAKKRRESEREGASRKRKRRVSEEGKNQKEKKRKEEEQDKEEQEQEEEVDDAEEEELDEDEMLGVCARGASPAVDLDKVEVWSGNQPISDPNWQFDEDSENESEFEDRGDRKRRRKDKADRRNFKGTAREDREIKKRLQMKRKAKNKKDGGNADEICVKFMKGHCNKGSDCLYSHAVCPPKKMEMCKFYLMDCCAKRGKCLYLHEEFPCKFFHTGLTCYSGKNCKFSHDPLNSLTKDILLKHLETAPKEILGDFPRLSRDCAETMVKNKTTAKPSDTSKIPSLFDIQVSIPPEFQNTGDKNEDRTTPPCSPPPNVKSSPKTKAKENVKFYKKTESSDGESEPEWDSLLDFAKELEAYKNKQMQNKSGAGSPKKIKCGEEMVCSTTGSGQLIKLEEKYKEKVTSPRENERVIDEEADDKETEEGTRKRRSRYEDRRNKRSKRKDEENEIKSAEWKKSRKGKAWSKKSCEKSDKANTKPARLTEDGTFGGIKFKIINRKEIRKSSDSEKDVLLPMKIEKPNEFLSSDDERPLNYYVKKDESSADSGLARVLPNEETEKFGLEVKADVEDETDENEQENPLIIETNDDPEEEVKPVVPKHLPKKQQELFLRIQAQNQKIKEDEMRRKGGSPRRIGGSPASGTGSEADAGKTPSPEPADENWYSSDDDDDDVGVRVVCKEPASINAEKNSISSSKESNSAQVPVLPMTKSKIDIPALSAPDLSKINITELLSSIRQVTNKKSQISSDEGPKPSAIPSSACYQVPSKTENSVRINYFNSNPEKKEVKDPRLRDPRINPESGKRNSLDKPAATGKTIYDNANLNADSRDSDLRFQSKFDSDERVKNLESVVPFGDVDLRTFGGSGENVDGDFDLRKFGLPFKPVPVHSAATEIDAGLNSHPPINYKVETILIPRPDFSSIKISPADPQVKRDPRLRRLFRINSAEGERREELQKKSGLPSDPRQRKPAVSDTPKSPPVSPCSPKQSESVLGNQNLLNANLLLLAQLGLSAAAAGTNVFDPRIQQLLNKTPQELELLRNQLTNIKAQSEFDLFGNLLANNEKPDAARTQSQGLLPTPVGAPPGAGLLGPAPGFLVPGIAISDPSVMMAPPLGSMPPNPMTFDPRFASSAGEDDVGEGEHRHYNRGFRSERRGRGNWRGNRDRNWDRDNRRHNKRDERDYKRHSHRDRDDRREKKRSDTPD